MKSKSLKYFVFAAFIGIGCTGSGKSGSGGSNGYQLVWSDEFNKDGAPDSSNWNYERGFVRNNEFQWYQPQNAVCRNGILTIEAKRESKKNPRYEAGSNDWRRKRENIEYTSTCMITSGKKQWTY
ncbi:MAG: hypothetical protein H7Y27_13755, partial [Gemmatimonadaceae bacterium]|nr:hypothetical protein [Chitinophagaceae bacterium]